MLSVKTIEWTAPLPFREKTVCEEDELQLGKISKKAFALTQR